MAINFHRFRILRILQVPKVTKPESRGVASERERLLQTDYDYNARDTECHDLLFRWVKVWFCRSIYSGLDA